MLRHIDEKGGIGVYTNNLLRELFKIDKSNQYILLYKDTKSIGKFSGYPNVQEMAIKMPTKLLWDQIAVPWIVVTEKLDLIFNPKLSVPLFVRCKTVFVFHGAEQFAHPEIFRFYDRIYFTLTMPFFCKKASIIISTTEKGIKDIGYYLRVNTSKIKPIHHGLNKQFLNIDKSKSSLENIISKYNLPNKYILFVGGLTPLKNIGRLLQAFQKLKKRLPGYKLVIIGFKRWKYKKEIELIKTLELENDVIFAGWVQDEDMPALYGLADVLAFPSLYEGFGIPLLEAMACGCPIVTSNTGGLPEVAGEAAVFVNPYDVEDIANAMFNIINDNSLRQHLIGRGYKQVKKFSWEKCASEVLEVFERLK